MSNPNHDVKRFYDVYENKSTGERVAYPIYKSHRKEMRSLIRFRRRVKYAIGKIKFNKWITLTYKNLGDHENDIRGFFNRWNTLRRKRGTRPLAYIWKKEYGKKTGRLHYHAFVRCNYVHYSIIRGLWQRGGIKIEKITTIQQATGYLNKYFQKEKSFITNGQKDTLRRWGTSRNIPKTPKSNWKHHSVIDVGDIGQEIIMHNEML